MSNYLLITTHGAAEGQSREIETGKNYISNGKVKVELQVGSRCRMTYSMWNEDGKAWDTLFIGSVGYGSGEAFDLLSNEPAEEVKTEKGSGTATMKFKLTDRTKYQGKGGAGFYQVYKVTIWKDKNKAYVELWGESKGGKAQMGWVWTIVPQTARYLIGKGVYANKPVVDCQDFFAEKVGLKQIGTGNKWAGAYNPENGYLYIIHYPKRYYLVAAGSSKGLHRFSHLNDNHSVYGINIGKNKEPDFAAKSAEKILTEKK